MLRQIKTAFIGASLILVGSIGFATPSQAATYSVNYAACDSASLNGQVINVPVGDSLEITFTSCSGGQISLAASSPAVFNASVTVNSNRFTVVSPSGQPDKISGSGFGAGPPPLSNGTYVVYFVGPGGGGSTQNAAGSFTVIVGGSSSSTEVAPAPTFEIALTPTDGTTCVNSKESAMGGTWLTLPGANDCTPPATKAGATLLGWSTTPDFPLDIARRQVANGWGTYEIFNDAGRITAVFIPAGRATFLSGTNTLYAIWDK